MATLDELLGIDPSSPEALRADLLVENDQALMDALVRVRNERGLTQTQVAEIMGVKQPSIADFEAHDSNPTLSRIRRYAHAVGALVGHQVEIDTGQLLDHRRDQWISAVVATTVVPAPSHHAPIEVKRVSGIRSGEFHGTCMSGGRDWLSLAA